MKVSIITLGCKVNQYESEGLTKMLEDAGIEVVNDLTQADCYIINTCAVTNEAERKSRNILSKIEKLNSNAPIYVCGCSSQHSPVKFTHKNVKAILGTSNKYEIASYIINSKKTLTFPIIKSEISSIYQDNYEAHGDRTRTIIKIQEGCNNFCSYCLIPYLRGRERSRSLESVKKEVSIQAKYSKEITFTGINLSAYGSDFEDKKSLKDIALLMREYPSVRFKFSSLEQNIITEDFMEILSKTPNFAPHFHLSLQSGSDKTLKAMNRKYTSKEYYKKIMLIRKYFPKAAITTDIIVGFPTETEEDFISSYNFAKKCAFAKIHIFPFSSRSGTAASHMKNIATNVKKRLLKLQQLDKQMHTKYINNCIGDIFNLIIEQKKDTSKYYEGHTENYIKCYIESDKKIESNSKLLVKIVKPFEDGALAEIVSY